MHAIRRLRESGHATIADYEKLLAPNVVFHSPGLIRPAEGRSVVAKIFATSTTLREGAYTERCVLLSEMRAAMGTSIPDDFWEYSN